MHGGMGRTSVCDNRFVLDFLAYENIPYTDVLFAHWHFYAIMFSFWLNNKMIWDMVACVCVVVAAVVKCSIQGIVKEFLPFVTSSTGSPM